MSLDKAIEHGHERRKPYTGSKAIDKTCRNHGGCDWCRDNRIYRYKKKEESTKQRIDSYNRKCKEEDDES